MADEPRGCLAALFGARRRDEAGTPSPTSNAADRARAYRRKFRFLSPAEADFFRVLQAAAGPGYLVFPKVRLVDVCYIPSGAGRRTALNQVVSKHLDFLVCDATTVAAVAAIELDDSSHAKPERVVRDQFVDEVLKAVELPLIRIVARASYDTEEVRAALASVERPKGPPQ